MAEDPPIDQECVEGYLFAGSPPKYLILRRPPERGGIWVPVSGKVEPADADFGAAVRREIDEETGFSHPRAVFSLDWSFRFDGPDGRKWRLHGFGVELEDSAPPRLSSEHDAFEWLGYREASERLHYPDNREALARLHHRLTAVV
ncbi:MAG: NUDIX domain-containing protein [Thermoplasmata archaeon]|nr:NUDIX domain-containing protein [Thermoplasmata archaeon]